VVLGAQPAVAAAGPVDVAILIDAGVRLTGLYALERLAQANVENRGTIVNRYTPQWLTW